jgi:branched-chain amino acid transport system ATP-binding protein
VTVLTVQNLTGGYRKSQVLFGVSLEVAAAEAVAILGRNGMGKTTLLQTVMGYLKPSGGTVTFEGKDTTGLRPEDLVRRGIAYVPQERNIFESLSVRENLKIGQLAASRLAPTRAVDDVIDVFPRLGERLRQRAGTLSGGERKMLAIARALLGNPRLLLLDEPTEGVWPGLVSEIEQRLARLSQSIGVLIVEQHISMALRLAHRAYVIDRGAVVMAGTSSEVRGDPRLYRYLAP